MAKEDLILIDNNLVDKSKLSVEQLGEMIRDSNSVTTLENLTEAEIYNRYGVSISPESKILGEIKFLKDMVREFLPEDCVEGYGEVKYCPNRLGDGNKCKHCDNL